MEQGEWRSVLRALEGLTPYYERVNLAVTFGLLPLWRREASQRALPEHVALEVGPATGGFARLLPCRRVYLLEPSGAMARYVRDRLPAERYLALRGVVEAIPLGEATVDRVFSTFSFRDFVDPTEGCREMFRVLKPGGEVHLVDVTRPPPGVGRTMLDAWIRVGAPALADVLIPGSARRRLAENPYETFRRTYLSALPLEEIVRTLSNVGFVEVRTRSLGLRGAFHAAGVKPRTT